LQGFAGAALASGRAAAQAPPDMLSAAYIVRRNGKVRLRSSGAALGPDGRWSAFGPRRPLRVASVSKLVTTAGFMTLVAAGRADLDADVARYLGAPFRHPAFPDTPITARMLLSHTSGVRNGADFPVPFNRSLLDRFGRARSEPGYGGWFAPAQEPPGVWFAYSDANFALVAQIVESIAGRRFDHFMRDTLFKPLGLACGYNWSGVTQRKRAHAAAGCRRMDGAWTATVDAHPPAAPQVAVVRPEGDTASTDADYRVATNGFAFAPHGGLRLSLGDMDALAQAFLSGGWCDARMAAPVWTFNPDAPNGETERGFYQAYGLATHIPSGGQRDRYFGADSSDWRGHFGDAYGWMTGLWWNARTRTTLVYAINGMPETDRREDARTALTEAEQALIDRALGERLG